MFTISTNFRIWTLISNKSEMFSSIRFNVLVLGYFCIDINTVLNVSVDIPVQSHFSKIELVIRDLLIFVFNAMQYVINAIYNEFYL